MGFLLAAAPFRSSAQERELVIGMDAQPPELDPLKAYYSKDIQVQIGLYEGLFGYDPSTVEPVKAAARSYTRSQDGLDYAFVIRDEAEWSDGSPLLAAHFRDAWLAATDPASTSPYAVFFDAITGARQRRFGIPAAQPFGVWVEGDHVLKVRLVHPAPYFTRLLCLPAFSPRHPAMSSLTASPGLPCNGPYRIAPDDGTGDLLMERNPHYWDAGGVAIGRIRFVFADDEAAMTRNYVSGGIDWLCDSFDASLLDDTGDIQANPLFATFYWAFDCSRPPWNDERVRRALALLLPWRAVRDSRLYADPADSLVLPFPGYPEPETIAAANVDEARRLLASAGFPEGRGLPPVVILCHDIPESLERARLLAEAIESLPGAIASLRIVPAAEYEEASREGGKVLFTTSWIGDFADPLAFLGMWESDSSLNETGFSDPRFDALIAASHGMEGIERLDALSRAEAILLKGAAILPVFHNIAINIVHPGSLSGWYMNPLDIHPLKALAFDRPRVPETVAKR